jgi:hypothetical protein
MYVYMVENWNEKLTPVWCSLSLKLLAIPNGLKIQFEVISRHKHFSKMNYEHKFQK